ncbi:MAG: hypothetical protein ACQEXQ_10510 [Bacillota bacterium]
MDHNKSIKSKQGTEMLENVRRICSSLLEVEEIIDGFGHTTFKVKGKSFIMMGENEVGAGLSFKSDRENQEILLQQGRFIKHGISASSDLPNLYSTLSSRLVQSMQ